MKNDIDTHRIEIKKVKGSYSFTFRDIAEMFAESFFALILQALPILSLVFIQFSLKIDLGYVSYIESIDTIVLVGGASLIYERILNNTDTGVGGIKEKASVLIVILLVCWSLVSFCLLLLSEKSLLNPQIVANRFFFIFSSIACLFLLTLITFSDRVSKRSK